MQGWFAIGAVWLLGSRIRPKRSVLALFLLASLGPVLLFVVHNRVFYGRLIFTAASGRSILHRILEGPPLPHPNADPTTEFARARQVAWNNRDNVWYGVHKALKEELAWSDAQIQETVVGWYLEYIQRYPASFVSETFLGVRDVLLNDASAEGLRQWHNSVRPNAAFGFDRTAVAGPAPPFLEWITRNSAVANTLSVLLLLLAPILARGRARSLALLAVASVAYFVFLSALVEESLHRYRIPAVPFMAIGVVLAVHGLAARLSGLWKRMPPQSPG
jgi:hypothetical protein